MVPETTRGRWNRLQVKVKRTELEISANILSQGAAIDVAFEIQQAISNVLRIHQAKLDNEPFRSVPFERTNRQNRHNRAPLHDREIII